MYAIVTASAAMFFIIAYSFGWWASSSIVDQTTQSKPALRRYAPTVPPPIPMQRASMPCAPFIAEARQRHL